MANAEYQRGNQYDIPQNNFLFPPQRSQTPYNMMLNNRGHLLIENNLDHSHVTGNGFSSQISPQNLSVLNASKHPTVEMNYEQRSSIEQADIDKHIKRNMKQGTALLSPKYEGKQRSVINTERLNHDNLYYQQSMQASNQPRLQYQKLYKEQQQQEYFDRLDNLIYEMHSQDLVFYSLQSQE